MNLDNYFAKFLHQGRDRRHLGAVNPVQVNPSAPTAAVTPTASAPPLVAGQSSPDEAAQRYSITQTGGAVAITSPTMKRPRDFSSGSSATVAVGSLAGHEEEEKAEGEELVVPSPTTRRLQTRRTPNVEVVNDDDDDELALLLGSQKAKQVREDDLMLDIIAQQASSSSSSRPSNGASGAGRDEQGGTACAVSSLPWSKLSNRNLDAISQAFHRQFEYELYKDETMRDCFDPFFKDRALERIGSGVDLYPTLLPAPPITQASIAASPGCELRDYQLQGVQFLLDRFHRGTSSILADDMGLGKTAQASAFLHVLKQLHGINGPHLVVAPLSTLTSWTRELARWAPQLRVVKYHGERRARQHIRSGRHNREAVYVTTPALVNQDKGFFRKKSWVVVVVDEAHVLKAHDTAITSVSRKLTASCRIAVTGTPIHNNVREVWSLMGFLYPWLICGYDAQDEDPVREAEACARVLQYIMLRRTKEEMELGIPPRIDEPVTMLQPTYVQSELLSLLTAQALESGHSHQQLRVSLSHQRAVCNHPCTLRLLAWEGRAANGRMPIEEKLKAAGVPMDAAHIIEPSAKMRFLDVQLPRWKAEGHRCLIFSNFTSTLDLLEALCHLRGFSYERLDGSCNRVERELSILRYNSAKSSTFLFLVTTTAGGVGVTLTGADTVVLFDAHFNPQLDRQAADRAHRIGQTRTVHVHRLCLRGTVEEHIRETAHRKASLGDFIVAGGQQGRCRAGSGEGGEVDGHMTSDDIRQMLQSLALRHHVVAPLTATASAAVVEDDDAPTGKAPGCMSEDDVMVQDLLLVEEEGLQGSAQYVTSGSSRKGIGLLQHFKQTSHCFVCGNIMHAMEPLYHCLVCPKAYHAACIGEKKPVPGVSLKKQWTCPRHQCCSCGKTQAADGAIFMCDGCPRSYCFDCLDPRYLELDSCGTKLLHVRATYADMDVEEMEEKRTCYYISCLHCSGVVSSSSDSEGENETEDEVEVVSSDDGEASSNEDDLRDNGDRTS